MSAALEVMVLLMRINHPTEITTLIVPVSSSRFMNVTPEALAVGDYSSDLQAHTILTSGSCAADRIPAAS
jgi:hypothetical protein